MSMWTALRNYLFFSSIAKKNREVACLLLSFGAGTNPFALLFGDSVIFFIWFNLLEFLWIYFTKKKIQANFDFTILRWINHKTPPLSLKQSAIFTKYRKSNIFNTECLFSYHLSFSNHNDKISVLSSKNDYFSKQLRNRKFELIRR